MAFDRNGTLRNAEKLLRSGKVDAAIAEYLRVIEDQPTDWATTNTLGDLYVRAGQVDKALEQYLKVAESFREEGQFVKAAALYKKILKLKPDDERTLMQAAELVASQGRFPDARAYLNTVLEKRLAAGDSRGAAMTRVRLGGLDPNDYAARMDGARARLEVSDVNGAVAELTAIAGELSERSRFDDAIEALQLAATSDPENEGVRTQLFDLYVSSDDFARAAESASTAAQFASLAESLELRERHDEAVKMLERAVKLDAEDPALRVRAAKALMARGNVHAASELLTTDAAGDDPQLMVAAVEVQLRSGHLDEGIALARRLIEQDPARREDVAALGATVAPHAPEAGFALVELSAEVAVANNDWAAAAAALQEFVEGAPTFIPALMRLVEICVDGGLDQMFAAQAQLADAYIATGAVAEARFIAEDLVAREPWERANIERFRRTLEMLGEPDPDGIIAERLSGESPFMSTDLLGFDSVEEEASEHPDGLSPELRAMLDEAEGSDFPGVAAPVESSTGPVVSVAGLDDLTLPGAEHLELHESSVVDTIAEVTAGDVVDEESTPTPAPQKRRSHFELSTNAIDLDSILGDSLDQEPEMEPEAAASIPMPSKRKPKTNAEQENVEVDLSIDLDGINEDRQAAPVPTPAAGRKAPELEPEPETQDNDLDSVFAQLRSEASRRSTGDGAEEQMKQGIALREAGKLDKALQAFEIASRSPRHRFTASLYAARIYRERDQTTKAIEWFERATQAPAPTTDDGFELLYELADTLEATGETARALAVCLEILADAGDYRDVKARVQRLSKVQARG